MGDWYRVTKKIYRRRYDYWQRTYRVGASVKTENRYIGPSSGHPQIASCVGTNATSISILGMSQYERTVAEHRRLIERANIQVKPPEPIYVEPKPKRENYTRDEWLEHLREQRRLKREYDAGMKRQAREIRQAKRDTRGIKAFNPFIARMLKK